MMLTAAVILLFAACIVAALALYASTAMKRIEPSSDLEEKPIEWDLAPTTERPLSSEGIPVHNT